MDFDYDSLAFLSTIVRTGSFESAAISLNVTQSAVSQRIKHLEDKIGTVLVVRGRPCVATEDGMLLCRHLEQVSLMRHEVFEQLSGAKSKLDVRVAVNSDSLATWFPEVVERAELDLNLRLEIVPDDQDYTAERLRSGDALAIVTSSEKPIPGCQVFPLGSMEYMAVASTGYANQYLGDGVNLANMSASPSIRFDQKDTLPQQWLEKAFGDTARLSSHFIPSYEGHLLCCRRGIGWVMMPNEAVEEHIASGELVEMVPEVTVRIPLFWHTTAQSSGVLLRLSEVVSQVAKQRLVA